MSKYRWSNPIEWLAYKIKEDWTAAESRSAFIDVLGKVGSDDIQDLFQTEMDGDGYFKKE